MIAGIFNGLMDTIQHHFDRSYFADEKDPGFRKWLRSDWLNKYVDRDMKKGLRKIKHTNIPIPAIIIDGWHWFKGCMILCLIGSVITFNPAWFVAWYFYLIYMIVLAGAWHLGFRISYENMIK